MGVFRVEHGETNYDTDLLLKLAKELNTSYRSEQKKSTLQVYLY